MAECLSLGEDDVQRIYTRSARPAREGEEAFRLPWELRSFALGVAYHEAGQFPWTDFQTALVGAIDSADAEARPEQYYARWVEALEALLRDRGGLDVDELDRRTAEILATPRDDGHTHPRHGGPIAVARANETTAGGHDHTHDHTHDHDHEHS
jgi:nitrile hydratase accessory protein